MTRRDPTLEVLRSGDLIASSPLLYAALREQMLAVLRERLPEHAQTTSQDALIALIEALAGALDTHGFYHDRALTESKVGSAQRLASLRLLGELVAFSPLPGTAARTVVQLLANRTGFVPAGSALQGKGGSPPEKVLFETTEAVSVGPAFNEMRLSPLVTRHRGASRVVVRPHEEAEILSTPIQQLLPGSRLVFAGEEATEVAQLQRATARALALTTGLRHGYAASVTTRIGTSTRIRHLRHGYELSGGLVAFEVSDLPLLYLPDPGDPSLLFTSLQVHIFDPSVDPGNPTAWDASTAWGEVVSFAESEASDRHYRLFVDDRLHTWILLRRMLGSRTLLGEAALQRVYVRFDVAVGRQVVPEPVGDLQVPEQCDTIGLVSRVDVGGLPEVARIGLDVEAYGNSLVWPTPPAGAAVHTPATRAALSRVDGLVPGQQVLIDGVPDGPYIRRLSEVSGRIVSWAGPSGAQRKAPAQEVRDPWKTLNKPSVRAAALEAFEASFMMDGLLAPARHADEFDPIAPGAAPGDVTFAPISLAGRGQAYALWADFYRQATVPVVSTDDGQIRVVVAQAGRSFLLLKDSSLIKPGDYFLIGQRNRQVRAEDDPLPETPWEVAEIVQAEEVHGAVVRLRYPLLNDYTVIFDESQADAAGESSLAISRVDVVPLVASVYYGDHFVQKVRLTDRGVTLTNNAVGGKYLSVELGGVGRGTAELDGSVVRANLGWDPNNPEASFGDIFLVLSGAFDTVSFSVRVVFGVDDRGLDPDNVEALAIPGDGPVEAVIDSGTDVLTFEVGDLSEADRLRNHIAAGGALELRLQGKSWEKNGEPLLIVHRLSGWHANDLDLLSPTLYLSGGAWVFRQTTPAGQAGAISRRVAQWAGKSLYLVQNDATSPPADHEEILATDNHPVSRPSMNPTVRWRVNGVRRNNDHNEIVLFHGSLWASGVAVPQDGRNARVEMPLSGTLEAPSHAFGAVASATYTPFPSGVDFTLAVNPASNIGAVLAIESGGALDDSIVAIQLEFSGGTGTAILPAVANNRHLLVRLAHADHPSSGTTVTRYRALGGSGVQFNPATGVRVDSATLVTELLLSAQDAGDLLLADGSNLPATLFFYNDSGEKQEVEVTSVAPPGWFLCAGSFTSTQPGRLWRMLAAADNPTCRTALLRPASLARPPASSTDAAHDVFVFDHNGARQATIHSPILGPPFPLYVDGYPWFLFDGVEEDMEIQTWQTDQVYTSLPAPTATKLIFHGPAGLSLNARAFLLDNDVDRWLLVYVGATSSMSHVLKVERTELNSDVLEIVVNGPSDDVLSGTWDMVEVAQWWNASTLSLDYGRAEVSLDSDPALTVGDVIDVWETDGMVHQDIDHTAVGVGPNTRYQLSLDPGVSPTRIEWRSAVATGARVLRTEVTLHTSLAHPVWFVSPRPWVNDNPRELSPDEFLTYTGTPVSSNGEVRLVLDAEGEAALFARDIGPGNLYAASGNLLVYTNQVAQLWEDLYLSYRDPIPSDPRIGNVLTFTEPPPNADKTKYLMAYDQGSGATAGLRHPGTTVILWSTSVSPSASQLPDHLRVVASAAPFDVPATLYTQSIVFNSGNFIPNDAISRFERSITAAITRGEQAAGELSPLGNALRVYRYASDPDTDPTAEPIVAVYDADLAAVVEAIDRDGPELLGGYPFRFSFGKTPEGVFTLNVLLLIEGAASLTPDDPTLDVYIQVTYAAARVLPDSPQWPYRYRDQTVVRPWNPYKQVVLLDPGELTPGSLLFAHVPKGTNHAKVESVDGRLISLDGPLRRKDPTRLDGSVLYDLGRAPKPIPLDEAYYQGLAEAELVGTATEAALLLRDRLVLNRNAPEFEALLPGDWLRVWDTRSRSAWRAWRQAGLLSSEPWDAWPDWQHEVQVKTVDWDTGLVTLVAPLPERFRIAYRRDNPPETGPLVPDLGDLDATEAQPHPRAAFYGFHGLFTAGSGDRSARFSSYTLELLKDPGFASAPVDVAGRCVANLLVLSQEPRSGEWTRWTPVTTLDVAGRGDAAVELSAKDKADGVEVRFGFGDGRTGAIPPTGRDNLHVRTTDIGPASGHVPGGRDVPVLEVRCACLPRSAPAALVAQPNLQVIAASSAAREYAPTGAGTWTPLLVAEVQRRCGAEVETVLFTEIRADEAAQGKRGLLVQAGPRPGTVCVSFYDATPITAAGDVLAVRLRERPVGEPWALDADWYAAAEADDPTRVLGARLLPLLETDGLRKDSLLALRARADAVPAVFAVADVNHDTFAAGLASPLPSLYDLVHAQILGNLVPAVQGTTDRFVLGSGDGASAHQRFAVHLAAPLLYVRVEGEADPQPDVQVWVDGLPWTRSDDFADAGPNDHVFCLEQDARGDWSVRFGDGVNGAVAPLGRDNVEVQVRTGNGAFGAVPVGGIDKLLDQHLAVRAVRNLTEGVGGRPAADAVEARDALLAHDPLPGRIVTVDDAVAVAQRTGDILHAQRDPTAPDDELRLLVALRDRREASAELLAGLEASLQARVPAGAGVTVRLQCVQQVAVHLVVEVQTHPAYDQAFVLEALAGTLAATGDGFFAASRWPIGRPLRLGDLYEALLDVPGVQVANVRWMSTRPSPSNLPVAPEMVVHPGHDGVIRCDNDRAGDPQGLRGRYLVAPVGGDQ